MFQVLPIAREVGGGHDPESPLLFLMSHSRDVGTSSPLALPYRRIVDDLYLNVVVDSSVCLRYQWPQWIG